MQQVITIGADGSMSGLQRKPGQGLDLRKFGEASIKRASLIEWHDAWQGWYIDVLQRAGNGRLTWGALLDALSGEYGEADVCLLLDGSLCTSGWGTFTDGYAPGVCDRSSAMLFREYDEAVKVEILYLDALRLAGHY